MNLLIYAGFAGVGAFFLLVDAYRNFASPLTYHPFELHPILRGVDVQKLCTPREWVSGYFFYSLLYLISYAIILSSAEVFQLVNSANLSLKEVGAIGEIFSTGDASLPFSSTDYGKPIFVSAFLIAFFSLGAVKPIESTMRSLAHRLAGVPSGVYRVIHELHKIEYLEKIGDYPSPLLNKFDQFLAATGDRWENSSQTADIKRSLATIDSLSSSIVGGLRSLYFPLADLEKLKEMIDRLDGEISALKADLDSLQSEEAAMESLHEIAASVANNTIALFAVLYIRNNRSAMKGHRENPVDKTIEELDDGYNPEQNSFAIAIVIAVTASLFLNFFLYQVWWDRTIQVAPAIANAQFSEIWVAEKAGGAIGDEREGCRLAERRLQPDSSDQVGAESVPSCFEMQQRAKDAYLTDQLSTYIGASFWDVLATGMMVLTVGLMSIIGREVRREQNSWKPWKFHQLPFLRILGLTLLPGIAAIFAVTLGRFFELVWDSGVAVTQTQIIFLFQGSSTYLLMQLGAGVILSFGTIILMDKHNDLHWTKTISLIAVPVSVLYFFYMKLVFTVTITDPWVTPAPEGAWPILSHAYRDTTILSAVAIIFLISFAILLELTERKRRKRRPGVSGFFGGFRAWSGAAKIASSLLLAGVVSLLVAAYASAAQSAEDNRTSSENGVAASADLAEDPTAKLLRIGVRTDARPFSFLSDDRKEVATDATPGPLTEANYSGYIVKICDAVLTEMLITRDNAPALSFAEIGVVNIDDLQAQDETKSRFSALGDDYDILCDPATITNDRRSGNMISPPLYLTGISYLGSRSAEAPNTECPDAGALIGVVGGTTAGRTGILAIIQAGELPEYRDSLVKFVRGLETCKKPVGKKATRVEVLGNKTGIFPEGVQLAEPKRPDVKPVEDGTQAEKGIEPGLVARFISHTEAAKAFCDGKIRYYVGDLEIIIASVQTIVGCEFDNGTRTYTNDRYAIFGKVNYFDPERENDIRDVRRAQLIARFFEVLSQKIVFHPSLIDDAFYDTFYATPPSAKLKAFFWNVRGAPAANDQ